MKRRMISVAVAGLLGLGAWMGTTGQAGASTYGYGQYGYGYRGGSIGPGGYWRAPHPSVYRGYYRGYYHGYHGSYYGGYHGHSSIYRGYSPRSFDYGRHGRHDSYRRW